MKINYIKLNNIGPYFGEHYLDFNTTFLNNIILIGGKNGAGKTSLLKAIKYGLFGCFSFGLKNETISYYNEIKDFINNKADNDYYIEIGFDFVENYDLNRYVIKRSWTKMLTNDINENVIVKLNNNILSKLESKEFLDKLKAITSPELINSFIFDGEKISSIVENGNINQYLKEVYNSMFNIDLIYQTSKDLESYLEKKSKENKSKNELECVTLINKINSLKSQIKVCQNDINAAINSKNNLIVLRKSNEDNYYKLGGIAKEDRENLFKKINVFESTKETMNKLSKDFIENDLSLFINLDLLQRAKIQISIEKINKYPAIIKELEELLNLDLSSLSNQVNKLIVNDLILHDVSKMEFKKLENRLNLLNSSIEEIKKYFKSRVSTFDQYKHMKRQISNNESIEELNNIINEIEKIDRAIENIDNQLLELNNHFDKLNDELELNYAIYERINEEMKKNKLFDSSFNLASDYILVCDLFSKKITERKLKEISRVAFEIFRDTIRKKEFISRLNITPDFDLQLYDVDDKKINPKILSAGETQILVSSLIWAMFKISGRREMFIFDTPLARLDTSNRLNFINNIISTISQQVVILSTDSEFIGENLKTINNKIFKKYLLNFDEKNLNSTITEDYFGGL